jgi:universal stress protein A
MLQPTKILIPTDFSQYSDKALRHALDIAKQYDAKVYLLHVVDEHTIQCADTYCLGEEIIQEIQEIENRMVQTSNENMKKQLERFPQVKEVEVLIDTKRGIPSEKILEEERERGIDLIIIASLGQTGLAKYFVGTVARNVLKAAKCPVLLVK